jgi:F-type H+-transporting ATPase subunit a
VPKRRILGFPIPVLIGILFILLVLFVIGFIGGALGRSMFGDLGLPSWLSVPRPQPELPAEEVFHLFGFPITNSIIGAWITMIFLVGFSYAVTRRMKIIPGRLQGAFEFLIGWLYDFCQRVAGEGNGRRFFPVVATIFLFVAFNAWLSLIPGFGSIEIVNSEGHHVHLLRGANTDVNMPLALALVSFVIVEYFGLKTLGIRYLLKFISVLSLFRSLKQIFRGKIKAGLSGLITGFIDIFVGILEALSELIRIVSFTFRLFGNMTAGEILLLIAAFLIPWLFALPFYGLELLVGFVQALIFGGLTLVFLTVAVAHHGD